VAAQNLRNETATRHGGVGSAEPNSYQLAIDTVRLLSDNDLGLPLVHRAITGARLVSRTAAMVKQGMSLMAIELRCTIPLDKFMTGDIGDFARMHVDWDIPPHGNVAPRCRRRGRRARRRRGATMSHLHLRPAPARACASPAGALLKDDGEHVPATPYFRGSWPPAMLSWCPSRSRNATATTRAKA
jgi:hypothetical protein